LAEWDDTLKQFFEKLKGFSRKPCMIWDDKTFTVTELVEQTLAFQAQVAAMVPPGSVVGAWVSYSFPCVALFLALSLHRNIIIPLSREAVQKHDDYIAIGRIQYIVRLADDNQLMVSKRSVHGVDGGFYGRLQSERHSGLVLFSSGSSGPPKGVVHDLDRLSGAYEKPGKSFRTLIFLQMDHIGGINTLFYNLRNRGVIIVPGSRMPQAVCRCIEKHQVELLPTSPTFLNLMVLSGMTSQFDLSSLKLITYGTEPMPEATLQRMRELLPHCRFKQTYGLSETGILNTRSRDDGSLWIKMGGNGFDIKVVDNKLWIKSRYAMLGYLNADSPFEQDRYINTGDVVEQDGEWLRILGRESELINVGGNKVFPAEVEAVLQKMPQVVDAMVYGMPNPLTGQVVAAVVKIGEHMTVSEFKTCLRQFCRDLLEPYKIPVKVVLTQENLHSERFKKKRNIPV
jgi:long-chain acyl-CoA synthetase